MKKCFQGEFWPLVPSGSPKASWPCLQKGLWASTCGWSLQIQQSCCCCCWRNCCQTGPMCQTGLEKNKHIYDNSIQSTVDTFPLQPQLQESHYSQLTELRSAFITGAFIIHSVHVIAWTILISWRKGENSDSRWDNTKTKLLQRQTERQLSRSHCFQYQRLFHISKQDWKHYI